MWKVMLVEDEPYVRRSIRSTIPWASMGFEVVAEAEDGRDAMELLNTCDIDVVFSDIIMPYMDGLTLLQLAKEKGCKAKFIMLTCMNEFEYARKAIRFGASGYILKLSMDEEELQSALLKVRQELEKERGIQLEETRQGLALPAGLATGWAAVMDSLLRDWYELSSRAGVNVGGATGSEQLTEAFAWKEERTILITFEQMKDIEFESSLRAGWALMRERALPVVMVKMTAERLDKQFARIAGVEPLTLGVIAAAKTHKVLLEVLLERAAHYGRRRKKVVATDHPEINKIMDYVSAHLDKELTLKAMASYVCMDEQYLSGLFKKKTGESFIQYVQRVRIEQAKFYLQETDLLISSICERVGFVHMNYFLKMFKKWTGLTPGEFRSNS